MRSVARVVRSVLILSLVGACASTRAPATPLAAVAANGGSVQVRLVSAPRTEALAAFVAIDAPAIALVHVRVIDGTGGPARDDQTIVIGRGRIAAIGDADAVSPPTGAKVIDGRGRTAFPGIVDMHAHLYYAQYSAPHEELAFAEQPFSFPRLYLAAGVTTARTTGSVEPYADLAIKRNIDTGEMPGPHLDVTAPYLSGPGESFLQMVALTSPEQTRRFVDFWADAGFTSFKAYMHLTGPMLAAAIDEAHARGAKITGHLCAVGFREAAALGIDGLEHGLSRTRSS